MSKFDIEAARVRVATLARQTGEPEPEIMAEDGGPHDELLAFCDKTDMPLDYVLLGAGPRCRTPVDPIYSTGKPEDAELKVYRIQGLAIAGMASTEPVLRLENTPLAIVSAFETIARLADEVTDMMAEDQGARRRAERSAPPVTSSDEDAFEVKMVRMENLVGALKVVSEEFKGMGNDDPIGRDRRDAVIGLAEAMAAVID